MATVKFDDLECRPSTGSCVFIVCLFTGCLFFGYLLRQLSVHRLPVRRLRAPRLPLHGLPVHRVPVHRLPVPRLPVHRLQDCMFTSSLCAQWLRAQVIAPLEIFANGSCANVSQP